MVDISTTDQKVNVHEARFGRDIQTQLNVGKDQLHTGQATGRFVLKQLLVGVGDVIVSDRNCLDLGLQPFERREVGLLGIDCTELVLDYRAGGMNMRLPTVPFRTATDHTPPDAVVRLKLPQCNSTVAQRAVHSIVGLPPETGTAQYPAMPSTVMTAQRDWRHAELQTRSRGTSVPMQISFTLHRLFRPFARQREAWPDAARSFHHYPRTNQISLR